MLHSCSCDYMCPPRYDNSDRVKEQHFSGEGRFGRLLWLVAVRLVSYLTMPRSQVSLSSPRVALFMRFADFGIRMKHPECNTEVPSDTCAVGAHAITVWHILVSPEELNPYEIYLDTLVFWFPSWRTNTRAVDNVIAARLDVVRNQFLPACLIHRYPTSFSEYLFCVLAVAETQHFLDRDGPHGAIQVVAVGKSFQMGFSAPLGGILLRREPIGDVIVLVDFEPRPNLN